MTIEFENISDLKKYIQIMVEDALKKEVAEEIKTVEMGAIQDVVYSAYGNIETHEPNWYERRYTEGGIADPENMDVEVIGGTLIIKNTTSFNDEFAGSNSGEGLASLIEYGNGNGGVYDFHKGKNTYGDFKQPRPFTQETINRLIADKIHIIELKKALKKRGLNVK